MQKVGSFYANFFIVILIFVAAFIIFHIFSNIQEKRAADNWAKTFGPIEDLPNKYPYRNDNEAAEQLKLLAVQLGINFNINGQEHRYTPISSDAERLEKLHRGYVLEKYFLKHFKANDDSIPPLPPFLTKYLADYRKKLDAVRDYILTSAPILWRQNIHRKNAYDFYSGMPCTTGIWTLEALMSYRTLELAAAHDYPEAEKYLEAKWKLNETFKAGNELESQRMAMRMDMSDMSLIRKLPTNENWIPKIMKHDYQKAYIKGLTLEAWFLWRERDETRTTPTQFSFLNNALGPYHLIRVSSVLEDVTNDIQRMATMNPCDLGRKEFQERRSSEWTGVPVSYELYEINTTYAEIKEIQLQRELTTKVIKVRHGYFPKDGTERSAVCKDGAWDYFRSADGSTTIKYRGPLELPRTPLKQFPSTFTVKLNN